MLRYRMNSLPTFRARPKFPGVLEKMGEIHRIRGYRYWVSGYISGHLSTDQVILYSAKGTARITGVSWGYKGEGPSGLVELLSLIPGITKQQREFVSFAVLRRSDAGEDWRLEKDYHNWRIIYRADGPT